MNVFTRSGQALLLLTAAVAITAGAAVGQTDITDKFKDANFRAAVYSEIRKTAPEPILDSDVGSIWALYVPSKNISDLSGIEYFTSLGQFSCQNNQLTSLDVSKNTALTELYVAYNYFAGEDDIIGLNKSTLTEFIFSPQKDINAILLSPRVIPRSAASEASAVSPVSAPSAAFAAGPNPVGVSSGSARFFWVGASIKSASISVYDASGSVVRKLAVSDGGAAGVRRSVGSWDLRDAGGRRVSAGTYLARGTVTSKDGKRERVSVVVGVR